VLCFFIGVYIIYQVCIIAVIKESSGGFVCSVLFFVVCHLISLGTLTLFPHVLCKTVFQLWTFYAGDCGEEASGIRVYPTSSRMSEFGRVSESKPVPFYFTRRQKTLGPADVVWLAALSPNTIQP
jgi:hypothetical protein